MNFIKLLNRYSIVNSPIKCNYITNTEINWYKKRGKLCMEIDNPSNHLFFLAKSMTFKTL